MMDATPSTPPPPRDDNSKEAINDPLALPSPEVLAEIARKQEARAAEIQAARLARRRSKKGESASVTEAQNRSDAAVLIQKNYRGHRTRRAMEGRSLDPSVRWIEALKDGELRACVEDLCRTLLNSNSFRNSKVQQCHRPEAASHVVSHSDFPSARTVEARRRYRTSSRQRRLFRERDRGRH